MNLFDTSDRNFRLLFFKVGDGNSCLVKCPDGSVVAVDFGSNYKVTKEQLERIRQNISSYVKVNKIKALILSSPDKSRYNKIAPIFSDYVIENVYYSSRADEASSTYPLDNYLEHGTAKSILHKNTGSPSLNEVTINLQNRTRLCCPFNYQYEQGGIPEIKLEESKLVLCSDKDKNTWEISMVSGNVKSRFPHKKRVRDTASLVTYIRINEQKAVLLGGASSETQEFLRAQHPEIMRDMINYTEPSYNLLLYPSEMLKCSEVLMDGNMRMLLGYTGSAIDAGEGVN